MSNANQNAPVPRKQETTMGHGRHRETSGARMPKLPGEDLTIEETLRVMDVAREMRDRRQTAEEMFRRDDLRGQLREKLVRTARLAGDDVNEAELDAAIDQYLANLHRYEDPPAGWRTFLAHCWIRRTEILTTLAGLAAAAGGLLYFFS